MQETKLWLIRAITNLHAGSGDADYGIVDKHVQRDPVTDLPTINASSIKGAFREALEKTLGEDTTLIFGSENNGGRNENLKQGNYRFFPAKLLALPIRSSEDFYYMATCPELLKDFLADAQNFGFKLPDNLNKTLKNLSEEKVAASKPIHYGGVSEKIRLEDWESQKKTNDSGLTTIMGPRVALLNASDFKLLSDELPIIARNHLENGISSNLWYEQVVPREARFYCPIVQTDTKLTDTFNTKLNNLLQIGGNATVGYGLCKFTQP